jgi:hypothetical protein
VPGGWRRAGLDRITDLSSRACRKAVTRFSRAAVLAGLLVAAALGSCGSDLHVSASQLPLAPGIQIAKDVELKPGITPIYARHLLLTGSKSLSSAELRDRERQTLVRAGWKLSSPPGRKPGLVLAHTSDVFALFGPAKLMAHRGYLASRLKPAERALVSAGNSVIAVQMSPPDEY